MRFLLVFILFFSSQAFAETNDDWVHITKSDGIDVYTKLTKKSPIQFLRAKGIVSASVEKICAIMRSVETATDWTPNLVERSYVENISDTEAILYDVSAMPWPVQDRELVLHHQLVLSEDKKSLVLKFKSIKNKKAKRNKSYVRAKVHHGEIRFRPVEDGSRTFVDMIVLVDPKGSLPVWIVNLLQVSIPHDFLAALSEFAEGTDLKPLPGVQALIDQVDRS